MPQIKYAGPRIAATTLDDRSWNAFQVSGIIDGEIVSCILDVNSTLYLPGDFPVEVLLGDEVRAHFTYRNIGDISAQFYYYTEILDPDGMQRAYAEGNNPCNPGVQKASFRTGYIVIDKGGTWVVHGLLWVL